MADYNSIDESIQAGTSNMTVLRDGVRATDEVRTLSLGNIDWFIFNNAVITNLYISVDSWIGIESASAQNLQLNYRSTCEAWYEYVETGCIRGHEYVKYLYDGASWSSYDSRESKYVQADQYAFKWAIYLFDTGQIYVHPINWPTSYSNGTYRFTCGSQRIDLTTKTGDIYFTPKNPEAGTNWEMKTGQPYLPYYYPHAYYRYPISNGSSLQNVVDSKINWVERCPRGSSVDVQIVVNGTAYDCVNGEPLPSEAVEQTIQSMELLVTLNANSHRGFSPTLFDLFLEIWDDSSSFNILLIFPKGNQNNFANAPTSIIVNYNGSGRLVGYGGAVAAFSEAFYPTDLAAKPNIADIERILVNGSIIENLFQVDYDSGYNNEHISVDASVYGKLTNIEDL